jgi:hypothetical protein
MTSGKQSKAQRRAEMQQRAAERRAAERRKKFTRQGLMAGAGVVVIVVVVLVIKLVTGTSTPGAPPSQKDPHVPVSVIPASLHMTTATFGSAGPETIPLAKGTKLATLIDAATGNTIDGVQCQTDEQTLTHVHTHLTIFVNGQQRVIPYGIGIPGFEAEQTPEGPFVVTGSCFYWLHTHATDGIIHIESPSLTEHFTLGQFFAEWGIPLSRTQVGPATGTVTAFFTSPGKKPGIYQGDPADLPLGDHDQIQLDVGTPVVAPEQITNWGSL